MSKSPKIRLQSFEEEWKTIKLKDISMKNTTKNTERLYTNSLTNSAAHGIVSQEDFFDKIITNAKSSQNYYVVKPDDFVYNPRISIFAPVGPINRNNLNITGIMSPLYYVFSVHSINLDFLEVYFKTSFWHPFMYRNGDTGARSDRFSIREKVFLEMPIPYPTEQEQTQVGKFFKELDDLIELQQQMVNNLKELKGGYMQKLFPAQDESVPEIRFQGFSKPWENYKLSDITDMYNNLRIPVRASNRIKGTTPYYGANGIQDYVEGFTHEGEFVLLAEDGANDLINYPANYVNGKVWVNNHAHVISGKKEVLDNLFLATRISSMNIIPYLVGGDRTKLNGGILKNMLVKIPCIEEQIQIGNFFKQLDENIILNQKELEYLQEMKKGFLQKMFV